jgi:diguanylate cyclase (GGDEF)-like protein
MITAKSANSNDQAKTRWALFQLPAIALGVIATIDALAVVLMLVSWAGFPAPTTAQWLQALVLAALGIGYAQTTGRVELVRQYLAADRAPIANVTAAWALPAALVLPPGLATLVNVALLLHTLVWRGRRRSSTPYRVLFVGAAGILATLGAAALSHATGAAAALSGSTWSAVAVLGIAAALVAYAVVDAAVVLTGIHTATRAPIKQLLLSRENVWFEVATMALGLVLAATIGHSLWLAPFAALVLILLQRSVLVSQLKSEADTDSKTGLLAPGAWRRLAEQELARADRTQAPIALMIIDLDHFKDVNDTHGHLTGDAVLAAVGRCLRTELRGYDGVGRHGGEEFAVILPSTDILTAAQIAGRLRQSIADLHPAGLDITASIGIAGYPKHGADLDTVFAAADTALFSAKRAGRDRIDVYSAA